MEFPCLNYAFTTNSKLSTVNLLAQAWTAPKQITTAAYDNKSAATCNAKGLVKSAGEPTTR